MRGKFNEDIIKTGFFWGVLNFFFLKYLNMRNVDEWGGSEGWNGDIQMHLDETNLNMSKKYPRNDTILVEEGNEKQRNKKKPHS